jgi:hypothetical protein
LKFSHFLSHSLAPMAIAAIFAAPAYANELGTDSAACALAKTVEPGGKNDIAAACNPGSDGRCKRRTPEPPPASRNPHDHSACAGAVPLDTKVGDQPKPTQAGPETPAPVRQTQTPPATDIDAGKSAAHAIQECGNLTPVNVDLQDHYDRPGVTYRNETMKKGEAYVMSFMTHAASAGVQFVNVQEALGDRVPRFLNMSKTRCDFTIPANYSRRGTTTQKYFSVGTPYGDFQMLEPNTRYYVNLKNEDAAAFPGRDTCDANKVCGFVLTFYRQGN